MPHIHTKPGDHDFTVSAFIIRTDGPEPRAILHMHKKLGSYMQFGGHIETQETPWQAIQHEIAEESGYSIDQLKLLQPMIRIKALSNADLQPYPVCITTHKFNDEHNHTDIDYAFVTNKTPKYAININESKDLILVNRAELVALPSSKIIENVREIYLFVLDNCLSNWGKVDASKYSKT